MTRDDITRMARDASMFYQPQSGWIAGLGHLERFAELVAAAEREACAQVVDAIEARCVAKDVDDPPLEHVAAAIRARSPA